MIKKQNIEKLLEEIIENLDWGTVEKWNNYDFNRLSELILDQTNTQLSSVTLKRVFGKIKYDSNPSIHTLNTLSQFRGYKDWRGFSSQLETPSTLLSPDKILPTESSNPTKKIRSWKPLYILLGVLAMIVISVAMSSKNRGIPQPEDFNFDHVKIGKGVPSSVVFRYDASKASLESKIEIQQNWDKSKRTIIQSTDSIHTSIYYYPGFFEAKLIVDDKVVQEKQVFIPSDGWLTAIEKKPIPMYVPTSISQSEDNVIGISPEFLDTNNFHPKSETINTNYSLVRKFPVFSDDFAFDAILKNAALGGVNVCQKIQLVILFEGDAMVIPIAQQGCVSNLRLYIPGSEMIGKKEDLSMFGVVGNDWIPIQVSSSQNKLSISIADNIVKTIPMSISPKRLVGFRFIFEGTGWVKNVNLNGEVIL